MENLCQNCDSGEKKKNKPRFGSPCLGQQIILIIFYVLKSQNFIEFSVSYNLNEFQLLIFLSRSII